MTEMTHFGDVIRRRHDLFTTNHSDLGRFYVITTQLIKKKKKKNRYREYVRYIVDKNRMALDQ